MKNSNNGRQKFLVKFCLLTRWLAYYVNTTYILNTILCHKNQYQLETFWIKPRAEAILMKSVCRTDEPNVSVSLDSFGVKITQYFQTSFSCLSLPVPNHVISGARSCSCCFQGTQNSKQETKPLLDLHCLFQYSLSRDLELTKMQEIILSLFSPALHYPQRQTGL